jgi:hypothetical protein
MSDSGETSGSTPTTRKSAQTPVTYGGRADESSTPKVQELSADEDDDLSPRWRARAQLTKLRPLLAPGAVFRLPDSVTGRTTKSGRRPAMIIGPVPTLDGAPEVVLGKQVRVCTRRSLKTHDVRPSSDGEILQMAEERHLLFTPKGLLRGFNKDGFFEIDIRLPISLSDLDPADFEDWLPRPFVDVILLKTVGKSAANPYPPSSG